MLKRHFGIAIALILALPTPTHAAQTFSEILSGSATLDRNGTLYRAGKGTRIYEGDVLSVPSRMQMIAPFGAATITKSKGLLRVLLSRREGCGVRVHYVYGGGINAYARPKTCANSSIVFESFISGAFFNPWINTRRSLLIPGTLIAQSLSIATGASFTLADRNESSILAVQSGAVEAQSQNVIVPVSEGLGNITPKGKPPGPAIALDESLALDWRNPTNTPTGFRLNAKINPLNSLWVQGVPFLGEEIPFPVLGNSLSVEVRSADGLRSRVYSKPLPRRR